MTDTTKKAMTLEQVRDELRSEAKNERLGYKYGGKWHDKLADAIDAHLAAQRKGDAVMSLRGVDEYGPMLDWYKPWTDYKTGTKFYTAPPRPRVEVTYEMVERACEAYAKSHGWTYWAQFHDHIKERARIDMRAALEAALSEKGHGVS